MSETPEECVLRLLDEHKGMFGWDLRDSSNGVLKRCTMYIVLTRMEDCGLVHHTKVRWMGVPEHFYTLTKKGEHAAPLKHVAMDGVSIDEFLTMALPVMERDTRWDDLANRPEQTIVVGKRGGSTLEPDVAHIPSVFSTEDDE